MNNTHTHTHSRLGLDLLTAVGSGSGICTGRGTEADLGYSLINADENEKGNKVRFCRFRFLFPEIDFMFMSLLKSCCFYPAPFLPLSPSLKTQGGIIFLFARSKEFLVAKSYLVLVLVFTCPEQRLISGDGPRFPTQNRMRKSHDRVFQHITHSGMNSVSLWTSNKSTAGHCRRQVTHSR